MGPWLERTITAEWMDQPDLDGSLHRQALAGLRRVNWWSGTARVVTRAIASTRAARQARAGVSCASRPLRILDLACGGGDVSRRVAHWAQRAGIPCVIQGWDRSSTALEVARKQARCVPLGTLSYEQRDALTDPIEEPFDVIYSTLFLHHLSSDEAVRLLQRMRLAAGEMALVDDLRRTRLGWCLAEMGCRILSRSPVVHFDGPASVRAAFTVDEATLLAHRAGWHDMTIMCHWPQRFLITWQRQA